MSGGKFDRKPYTLEERKKMRASAETWDGFDVDSWDEAEAKGRAETTIRLLDMLDAAERDTALLKRWGDAGCPLPVSALWNELESRALDLSSPSSLSTTATITPADKVRVKL